MSDRLLKESDVIEVVTQYISCDYPTEEMAREDAEVLIGRTPSADRPQREWIIHYRDKWMVKAECPKCHRRFEFSPRAIWKCCPMCETRMKGADYETAND